MKIKFLSLVKHFYTSNVFYKRYGLFAQLRAGVKGGDAEMAAFLDEKTNDIQSIENELLSIQDDSFLQLAFKTEGDAGKLGVLTDKLKSLDTDEKKQIALLALANLN